jgi:hypothetical protein
VDVINGAGVCEVPVGVCLVTQCSWGCVSLMTFVVETEI